MENNFTNDTLSKLKALGVYQIAGGIIGLCLVTWMIANLTTVTPVLLLLFSVVIGLYVYSIYCGVLLLKKKASGLNYSLINQVLQLLNFSIAGFTFQYVSGVFVSMGFDLTNSFFFIFNFGVSSCKITINDDAGLIFNFNFVSLFLIIFIYGLKKKIQQEHAENQIASIGQE